MGMFDFFFPQESQAMNMRRLADNQDKVLRSQKNKTRLQNFKNRNSQDKTNTLKKRVSDLEDDLGFLALLVAGIVDKLDENQVVHKNDLKEIIEQIDEIDGKKDGKLDINVLRGQTS